MADNYIEKQMDAFRSGKLSIKAKPGIKPRGKRILIAVGCQGEALEKALDYRKEAHRVAVFDRDEAEGKRLAHDYGIRFHRVSFTDEPSLKREIDSLLSAWRGIDTLIAPKEYCSLIEKIIRNWKETLPIPDRSALEIVIISQDRS